MAAAAQLRAERVAGIFQIDDLDIVKHFDGRVAPGCGPAAQSGRRFSWEDEPMDEEVIPVLRVSDAAAAAAWYQRLGFTQEWEHRFEPGFPAFVSIARGGVRLFLSEHTGDAHPDTLIYLRLRDIATIAEEFGAAVEQMPWGEEVWLRDPDGNRLRVGIPAS